MPEFSEIYNDAQSSVKAAIAAALAAQSKPYDLKELLSFSENGQGEFLGSDGIKRKFRIVTEIQIDGAKA